MDEELKNLAGIVVYTPERTEDGSQILKAKWVSTRIVEGGRVGTGQAVATDTATHGANEGFVGNWIVKYFGPEGGLQVTPFLLELKRVGDLMVADATKIYFGQWSDPDGSPLLNGFGMEMDGNLCMRYSKNI